MKTSFENFIMFVNNWFSLARPVGGHWVRVVGRIGWDETAAVKVVKETHNW